MDRGSDRGRSLRILLGVSGGIAAYKAPNLVRAMIARGHEVQVITTDAAGAFVSELALATVSRRPLRRSLLDPAEEGRVGHIELADWPDVVVVAPATAHVLARAAHGLADDLLTTVLLATRAPLLWAPAMNTNMWEHPATRENLARLAARGDHFVGPDRGDLACGWVGAGRMIDEPEIVAAAEAAARGAAGPWRGRHLLLSAGPTRAYLDPVRFLSNASTGVMGFALAAAAARRGARVSLVAGPVGLETPAGVDRVDVETADELLAAMEGVLEAEPVDLVAMVAAVADLAPATAADQKLDKGRAEAALAGMTWRREVDVLATLTARHGARVPFLGFAAQTVDAAAGDEDEAEARVEAALLEYGREKLDRKGARAIFVNRVGVSGLGFGSPTNAGYLIVREAGGASGELRVRPSGPPMDKGVLAEWLLDELEGLLPAQLPGGGRGDA